MLPSRCSSILVFRSCQINIWFLVFLLVICCWSLCDNAPMAWSVWVRSVILWITECYRVFAGHTVSRGTHSSGILQHLHWLPIKQRIKFNLATLMHNTLTSSQPAYLCSLLSYHWPVLHDLHWLPVRQRISFKLAMMVYKCLHGLVPSYWLTSALPSRPSSALVAAAVGEQRDTRCARYKDHHRPALLRGVQSSDMEQSPGWTADLVAFHWHIRKKAENTFVWLWAPLKTFIY